jgi:drug/metabolite transporter (DMT)-like permease
MKADQASSAWIRAMPWVFVLIWSTGFIVAKYGLPHAPPLGFLAWRYFFSIVCFLLWIQWAGAQWPRVLPNAAPRRRPARHAPRHRCG